MQVVKTLKMVKFHLDTEEDSRKTINNIFSNMQ